MPKVSVVITCYNYGRFLKGALTSVLNQSFTDFEVIVVNDGSTDDTDQIMQRFAAHSNLTYISQENAGQAHSKNVGIAHSRGEFVAFLDADDRWEHDKLQKQMELFRDEKVGVVYSRARYVDEQGLSHPFRPRGRYLIPRAGKVTDHLIFDNFVPFSSSVVRRSALERCGVFDESLRMGIDWDLWLRISTAYHFAFVDEPLLVYRVGHAGQMSHNMEERHRCADGIMKKFLSQHAEIVSCDVLKRAQSYTFCNRGYYFRGTDWGKSNRFYLDAIRECPFQLAAYRGLCKNMMNRVLGCLSS